MMGVPHLTCYRVDRLDTYNRIKPSIITKFFLLLLNIIIDGFILF